MKNIKHFKFKFKNRPEGVHIRVDENLNERKQEIEDEPDVDHLDVGGLGQVVRDIDEHGGQHEHCFGKELSFPIICNLPVRLTVTTASKKKGLKKFVAWPITFRRTVGR